VSFQARAFVARRSVLRRPARVRVAVQIGEARHRVRGIVRAAAAMVVLRAHLAGGLHHLVQPAPVVDDLAAEHPPSPVALDEVIEIPADPHPGPEPPILFAALRRHEVGLHVCQVAAQVDQDVADMVHRGGDGGIGRALRKRCHRIRLAAAKIAVIVLGIVVKGGVEQRCIAPVDAAGIGIDRLPDRLVIAQPRHLRRQRGHLIGQICHLGPSLSNCMVGVSLEDRGRGGIPKRIRGRAPKARPLERIGAGAGTAAAPSRTFRGNGLRGHCGAREVA